MDVRAHVDVADHVAVSVHEHQDQVHLRACNTDTTASSPSIIRSYFMHFISSYLIPANLICSLAPTRHRGGRGCTCGVVLRAEGQQVSPDLLCGAGVEGLGPLLPHLLGHPRQPGHTESETVRDNSGHGGDEHML